MTHDTGLGPHRSPRSWSPRDLRVPPRRERSVLSDLLTFTVIGIVLGSTYAIAASGLVLTYATSNVFNFAHGAVGMVMTFLYWELYVNQGWPLLVVLPLILLVLAPAVRAGHGAPGDAAADDRRRHDLARRHGRSAGRPHRHRADGLEAAGAQRGRLLRRHSVSFGLVRVTAQQFITMGIAIAVAVGLYVLLNRTRIGTAMRAVVDNRELLALHGARPNLLSGLAWALGSSLAALAGILLAPALSFDYTILTFLVVNAYAAAMVGRLKSLPRTFAGAIGLGLLINYGQWAYISLPESFITKSEGLVYGIKNSLPTIFLLGVMLLLPQEKLRVGRIPGTKLPQHPVLAPDDRLVDRARRGGVLAHQQHRRRQQLALRPGHVPAAHHAVAGAARRLRRRRLPVPAQLRRRRGARGSARLPDPVPRHRLPPAGQPVVTAHRLPARGRRRRSRRAAGPAAAGPLHRPRHAGDRSRDGPHGLRDRAGRLRRAGVHAQRRADRASCSPSGPSP